MFHYVYVCCCYLSGLAAGGCSVASFAGSRLKGISQLENDGSLFRVGWKRAAESPSGIASPSRSGFRPCNRPSAPTLPESFPAHPLALKFEPGRDRIDRGLATFTREIQFSKDFSQVLREG